MANHWMQTKTYVCLGCGERLLHDRMHGHWAFHCPARQRLRRPVLPMIQQKVYRPEPGR